MAELELPEAVEVCGLCKGYGSYAQRFIEGRICSRCDWCRGAQFVYAGTTQAVPSSVRSQVANANDLVERRPALIGLGTDYWPLWPRDSNVDDWHLVPSQLFCYEIGSTWPDEPKAKAKAKAKDAEAVGGRR